MFIKRCSRSIFLQVVIGLVIGVICGVGIPDLAVQMKPLGDGFIKLIKMLIALIVFCVVVNGISGAGDLKKVGRIGLKSVIYFEILTTIALVLGLVVAYSLGLGSGANIHLNELPAGDVALYTGRTQEIHGPVAFLMGLIPTSVFSAFAENDILHPAVLRAVRQRPEPGRRAGQRRRPPDQRIQPHRVPHHGHDRAPGTARRVRRGGLHHRPLRRRLAQPPGRAGAGVLRHLPGLRHGGARQRPASLRGAHAAVPALLPRRAADRDGHRLLRRGAAAGDAQARAHGHPQLHGRPGDSHRLLVQPRRILDLPDPGGGVHRPRHRHAAGDDRPGHHPAGFAGHLQGRPRHSGSAW